MTDSPSFSSPIFERARKLSLQSSLPTFAAERRALAFEGHPGEVKPPKRGASREAFSDTLNSLGRVVQDALAEANGGSFREAWRMYLAIFGNNCYLCGLPFGVERALTVQADHIYPPRAGGAGGTDAVQAGWRLNQAARARGGISSGSSRMFGVRRSSMR